MSFSSLRSVTMAQCTREFVKKESQVFAGGQDPAAALA